MVFPDCCELLHATAGSADALLLSDRVKEGLERVSAAHPRAPRLGERYQILPTSFTSLPSVASW